MRRLVRLGVDFQKSETCMVDLHAAMKFMSVTINNMPCLTASRGGLGGYYITNQDRVTWVVKMARLQGWRSDDIGRLLKSGQSERQVGKALGNGMSINVLYRLLPRALYAAGLLVRKPTDVFKAKLYDLKRFEKRRLPDALWE